MNAASGKDQVVSMKGVASRIKVVGHGVLLCHQVAYGVSSSFECVGGSSGGDDDDADDEREKE